MTTGEKNDEVVLNLSGDHYARPEGPRLDKFELARAPLLDVVSPVNQKARQKEFFNDLCKTDRRLAKTMQVDPFIAYSQRLEQIRAMQQTQSPCFRAADFLSLLKEIAQDFHPAVYFTHDAVDAIQQMVEGYLVGLMKEAYLCSLNADRFVLTCADLQLARRIRGDRC